MKTKGDLGKTEFWLSLVTVATALTAAYGKGSSSGTWIVSLISVVLTAGSYAALRTGIVAGTTGWKTKAFWGSMLTVVASCAAAVTNTEIPGLPEGTTKVASVISAALMAAGYTAIRAKEKKKAPVSEVAASDKDKTPSPMPPAA